MFKDAIAEPVTAVVRRQTAAGQRHGGAEVAAAIGVADSTVWNWEHGLSRSCDTFRPSSPFSDIRRGQYHYYAASAINDLVCGTAPRDITVLESAEIIIPCKKEIVLYFHWDPATT